MEGLLLVNTSNVTCSHHFGTTMSNTWVGSALSTERVVERNSGFVLRSVSQIQFESFITNYKEDKFAKTFLSKGRMMGLFPCVGCWKGKDLAGAIAWSISKHQPKVLNLQLLMTFYRYRRCGVATLLCQRLEKELKKVEYFRVSAEPEAVPFYLSLGVKFLGEQKSGTLLSVGIVKKAPRLAALSFDASDPGVRGMLLRKGRGGCVRLLK